MTTKEGRHEPGTAAVGRIVVGFDGSEESLHAVRWAAAEAARRGHALRIVTAFGPDYIFTTDEEATAYMEKVADPAVREAGEVAPRITIEHRAHRDLPAQALRAESGTAQLLVVGSRGRGGFAGLLLGSVSRQCVHRAMCPVVVVRPTDAAPAPRDAAPKAGGTAGPRIVVGVDGSHSSNAALRWAAAEAEATGARLELIETWEWLASAGWAMVPQDFDPRHDAETVLDEAVGPIRVTHPTLEITTVVAEGQAAEELVEASAGAELLVVGCRGHGELGGMLLGSVSEYCVCHAHCPVMVIRGPDAPAQP